jgi:hypothetical protein
VLSNRYLCGRGAKGTNSEVQSILQNSSKFLISHPTDSLGAGVHFGGGPRWPGGAFEDHRRRLLLLKQKGHQGNKTASLNDYLYGTHEESAVARRSVKRVNTNERRTPDLR